MSVIGIDIGSTSSVIAVIRAGGIDIVVNEVSNRRTPSVVGFTDKLRIIGEAGYTQRQRNVRNTISGTKRILGRKFDELLKKELPTIGGCNWVELPDGSVGAQVSLRNQKQTYSSQQLTAMFLAHQRETCETYTKTRAANAVVSVPGYYTDSQRRALLDSCKIAGITCLQVINDLSAVSLLYGFYREQENMDSKVMFVDVGSSDMSVCIAHFTPGQCLILSYTYDAHLGGNDIDKVLAEFFADRFKKDTRLDVRENQRAWQRVLDGVERVKKTLNENEIAGLNIECILEDRDLNYSITRSEYLSLLQASGLLERIGLPIKNALDDAGLAANSLDSVEWIGSAMRATPLQDAVAKAVGRPLSSTMNAEESVAKGCSLACALVSPLIRLNKKYKLIDIQPSPITLSWKTLNDPTDTKESSIELFPRKQHFGKTKIITITRKEAKPFELIANYTSSRDFPLMDISAGNVFTAKISNIPKEADEHGNRDAEVRMKIRLDPSGTTQIVEAELMEKKEVEVDVPIEPPAASTPAPSSTPAPAPTPTTPAPPETTPTPDPTGTAPPSENPTEPKKEGDVEMKEATPAQPAEPPKPQFRKEKRLKTFYHKLAIDTKYIELSTQEIEKLKQIEDKLRQEDQYAIATSNAKNTLEAFILDSRTKIGTIWSDFAKTEEAEKISTLCGEIEDWLYNEGCDEVKEEYDRRLGNIRDLTGPVQKREFEWSAVPPALSELRKSLDFYRNEISGGGDKYSHIEKDDLDKVIKKCDEADNWLAPLLPLHSLLQKTSNPVFNSSDLIQRKQNVVSYCQPILNKPKPIPKEEPAPAPAPASGPAPGPAPEAGTAAPPNAEKPAEQPKGDKMDTTDS